MEITVLLLAFLFDFSFGDPVYRLHPVRIFGNWIKFAEKNFFKSGFTSIFAGILFWIIINLPFILFSILVTKFLLAMNFLIANLIWQSYVLYSCFAFRDMIEHINPVTQSLQKNNLARARLELKKIVGRDVDKLGKSAVIKASIESLAESFMDGYLAPLFWYTLGCIISPFDVNMNIIIGILLVIMDRCTNTLDSMVGYRNDKYENFGKFSARMDDVLNFIPARICILMMLPGIFISGGNVRSSIVCFLKDRLKSASPNAAHPISAFAGALDISLGGNAVYGGYLLEKPVLGEDFGDPDLNHLKKAAGIFITSGFFTLIVAITLLSVI